MLVPNIQTMSPEFDTSGLVPINSESHRIGRALLWEKRSAEEQNLTRCTLLVNKVGRLIRTNLEIFMLNHF